MTQGTEATQNPTNQRGLRCPKCGCGHFRVIYARAKADGRIIRRRECRYCGKRITTSARLTQ